MNANLTAKAAGTEVNARLIGIFFVGFSNTSTLGIADVLSMTAICLRLNGGLIVFLT